LIYIPRDASEILLRDITRPNNGGVYSAAQQWVDLNNYINQDPYLSTRRGMYAERNGGETPWVSQFDLSVKQDFNIKIGNKVNTLQVSLDMFNFGNYISENWGLAQNPVRSALINFVGWDNGTAATATGRPVFQFPERVVATRTPLTDSYLFNTGIGARWQAQVGVRYIFN
jgi:hypothetical protein